MAIPLYRSSRFADNVSANVEAMPADAEVLISDRHRHDDALERLERRHSDDRRVRFLCHRDGKDWIDHINILLREARADYWRLMPHDDFAPADSLEALVRCLDDYPATLLAYGPTTAVDLDGNRLPERDHRCPHPIGNDDPWTLGLALDSFWRSHFTGAFKGLVRRREVVDRGLWIRRTLGTVHAERLWLSALALIGRFRFVPEGTYEKRFYPESTHAQWRPGIVHELSVLRVLLSYFRDLLPERHLYRDARAYLLRTTAIRLGWAPQGDPPPPTEPAVPGRILGPALGRVLGRRRIDWPSLHHYQHLSC